MIQSYDDLYAAVLSALDDYSKQKGAVEIVFSQNDNGTCEFKHKANGKKFVLMFARFGDEYKVGYAFYEPDPYGGYADPEWIDDCLHDEFDQKFVTTLIEEHLL